MNRVGEPQNNPGQGIFNATLIRVATQVGCFTFVIIFAALIGGLLLDQVLDTRPLFTILLLVGSMPVSWVAVYQIVNRAKDELRPPVSGKPLANQEEVNSE